MAKKKENKEPEKEKTIDELAREALAAIKESAENEERQNERDLREELKRKEAELKNEAERKIKRKLRRLEKEEEKKPKVDEVDTRFMVSWTNPDGVGKKYIGEYEEEPRFAITRGMNLFHLRITGKNLVFEEWRKNAHTSVSLDTLKAKADKILKESNKAKEELKKKENPSKK
jgi:hypothetical protein